MELVLLGTGCPQCDPARLGPASLVRSGRGRYLVDCGSGVSQRLVAAGTPGRDLDAVFLTHLHSDHVVDLFQLVISSWHQGRDRALAIYGPKGTRRFCEATMTLWAPEIEQRVAHEKRPSTAALLLDVVEFEPGEIYRDDAVCVRAVAVNHFPVRHAVGFVFSGDSRRLAFSGDTAFCPALVEAARGADALVHECFIHREMTPREGVRTAEGIASVASYHTLSSEVGKVAAAAEVGVLILNHFVPTAFDRAALIREVRADWSGPLVVGEDLMAYDLETRVLRHAGAAVALAV